MRITFVVPHQRPTSGGVYTILQYAQLLSTRHEVTIAVGKGETRDIEGCAVVPLRSADDADVVVYPADWNAPIPEGEPVCYLQGFGTPGNPTVYANLKRRHLVIASANWLAEEARAEGCQAVHVPYGIDRSSFFPGEPVGNRSPSVLMMTHTIDWKGTQDGLDALEYVRLRVPAVEVTLFGIGRPDSPGVFVPSPPRATVGKLMREAAVFMCASWEEGFGIPGLEAMACGTAVATTDTKGSRDYALHTESALVVEPRDPEALGQAVVRLLEEVRLRNQISAGGLRVADGFPDWASSAELFEHALAGAYD
jgi:glycosyltransferase involved in cell wall biosynthesis